MKANEQKNKNIGDHLLAAIKDGSEETALFHLNEWVRSGLNSEGDSESVYEAFWQGCDAGFSRLARSMLLVLPEAELDRSEAFNIVAHSFDYKLLGAVIDLPFEGELWSMAYKARCFDRELLEIVDSEAMVFVKVLIGRARELRRGSWKQAQSDTGGLAGRWGRRACGLYETACEKWSVPIWSAAAACQVDKRGEPENMEHCDWALAQPEETLLWGAETMEAWRLEFKLHPEISGWRAHDFEALAASWDAASMMLPWIRSEMELCRKENTSERAQEIANRLVAAKAERWIPFILAWGTHDGFVKKDTVRFAPMLDAARVDVCNVGLVAANLDFGSFNARIARIVEEVRRRGGMDDAAVWVAHARWEDLFANPAWSNFFDRSSFQDDFLASRAFFEGEVLSLSTGAGIKKSRPSSI